MFGMSAHKRNAIQAIHAMGHSNALHIQNSRERQKERVEMTAEAEEPSRAESRVEHRRSIA